MSESNPGPLHFSDLSIPFKVIFNQASQENQTQNRTLRKSPPTSFTAYTTHNLIPKGLLPKCTPAIFSDNPQFWTKWNENLNNLAKKQLKNTVSKQLGEIYKPPSKTMQRASPFLFSSKLWDLNFHTILM